MRVFGGNRKIGQDLRTFSFAPVIFCDKRFPCTKGGCYYLKPSANYVNFASVRNALAENTTEYIRDPERAVSSMLQAIVRIKKPYFRFFVAGDCPDSRFAMAMLEAARLRQDVSFLAYTKKYEIFLPLSGRIPKNLVIRFSAWYPIEIPQNWPWYSWIQDDPRKPRNGFPCPGKCDPCGHTCWDRKIKNIILKRI